MDRNSAEYENLRASEAGLTETELMEYVDFLDPFQGEKQIYVPLPAIRSVLEVGGFRENRATCPYTSAELGTTGENTKECGQIAEPGSEFCAGHQ